MKFWPGVVPQCPTTSGFTCDELQRLLQQRIVVEIDLADRQIVGGAPVGVHLVEQLGRIAIFGSWISWTPRSQPRPSTRHTDLRDHEFFVRANDADGRRGSSAAEITRCVRGVSRVPSSSTPRNPSPRRSARGRPARSRRCRRRRPACPGRRARRRTRRSTSSPGSRTARPPRPPARRWLRGRAESRMSELVSDMPSKPGLWIDHLAELRCASIPSVRARYHSQAGIEVARARAHRHAGGRREAHAGVDGLPSRTAARLAPLPSGRG